MTSTSAIPPAGPAELDGVRTDEPFANQKQEANFKLALASADTQPGSGQASTILPLDQSALNAADEAWVNFVAISEQLQNPQLSQDKQHALLADLEENLRTFRQQSEPIVQQVDNYFASRPKA